MFSTINKMLNILSPREKVYLYLIIVGSMILAVVEIAGIASIMPFMAVVADYSVIDSNKNINFVYRFVGIESKENFLIFLGSVVLIFLVLSNLFKALMVWATLVYDNRLNSKLSQRLILQYIEKPYVFFLNRNTSELGKNILSEVRTVIAGVLSPGVKIISSSIIVFFILAMLFAVNPIIAISIFLIFGGSYACIYYFVRLRLKVIGENQIFANNMKFKIASEALSGIKDIKVLGKEKYFIKNYSHYADNHSKNNVIAGSISQLPKQFLEIVSFGGILLIVLYFLKTGQSASQMVPLLALYAFAGYRLMPALQDIFSSFTTLRYSVPSLEIIHSDLKDCAKRKEISLSSNNNIEPIKLFKNVELRNVGFKYPGAMNPAIDNLNIKIYSNTTVGIVGTTGSGKTTTVDIILGLLYPTNGYLFIDDIVVNDSNIVQWQLNLGYVPQHIYLMDDTLLRNIAFGIPDSDIDMEAVLRSARIANLAEFVEQELPQGYETIIGERGVRLSGGQRQRIGIARALYRNPSVLVMDEATSALDGITETAVMEAMRRLSGEKTIILIAHRLTTVKDCDVIYQLEQGRLVNHGTYAELQSSSEWFHAASKINV